MTNAQDQPIVFDKEVFARASVMNDTYRTCVDLLNSGVFTREGYKSGLFEAAVVHLLINLNDLVQKAAHDEKRIAATEHVQVTAKVADVTDLIRTCRNAAVHMRSPLQEISSNRIRFAVIVGKGTAMEIDNVPLESEFTDEIAIFYGAHRLYLQRNVHATLRLIEQAYPDEVADDWMLRLRRKAHWKSPTDVGA